MMWERAHEAPVTASPISKATLNARIAQGMPDFLLLKDARYSDPLTVTFAGLETHLVDKCMRPGRHARALVSSTVRRRVKVRCIAGAAVSLVQRDQIQACTNTAS